MAYTCVLTGCGECDGCGECRKPKFVCPVCDAEEPEKLYKRDGDIIGCSDCVEEVDSEDYLED